MNNAVFGKTKQNIRKHRFIKLISACDGIHDAKHLIASPNFQSRAIFRENLMAVELKKCKVVFTKRLEINIVCLYNFHYEFILQMCGPDICKL